MNRYTSSYKGLFSIIVPGCTIDICLCLAWPSTAEIFDDLISSWFEDSSLIVPWPYPRAGLPLPASVRIMFIEPTSFSSRIGRSASLIDYV